MQTALGIIMKYALSLPADELILLSSPPLMAIQIYTRS